MNQQIKSEESEEENINNISDLSIILDEELVLINETMIEKLKRIAQKEADL